MTRGKRKTYLGERFGRLLVTKKGAGDYYWCRCDCGNLTIIRSCSLGSGNTKSCGCLKKESAGDWFKRAKESSELHKKYLSGQMTRERIKKNGR